MRTLIIATLVLVDLCLAYALIEGRTESQHLARAFVAWQRNPTPETKQELERQKRINDRFQFAFDAVILCLIGANTYGIVRVWRQH